MCGIVGIFGEHDTKKNARFALRKALHRGSSNFELKSFPNATIGANRLPIVDRQFGKQPSSNEDGTLFAVHNGEIFNYRGLQKELETRGHKFKTDSDTEVLVHLFEEYGVDMLQKLDSEMFAFIIYNEKDDSVFAARDTLGVKPLFYAKDSVGRLYFASELKQLSSFDGIHEIKDFPPSSYYFRGKFKKYNALKVNNRFRNEKGVTNVLQLQIVEAVRKRVQTDLPIGVFLSGGVDSSLIMEIATRFHTNVTAIILGFPGSSDYEFALRLCKERGYKYHVVRPDVDYEKELDNLIYYLETYEPLIIRQSFSLDLCAREAQRLGLRIILVGEGSDELFGGYNEFSALPSEFVNQGCKLLTESLHSGHLLRVDRMSMKHTIEIRSPFFDNAIVKTALQIDGSLKVQRVDHQVITKYILRKVAERFLPDYVAWRYKVPFSNGAGMNVGSNFKTQDGDVAKAVLQKDEEKLPAKILQKYQVDTKEGKYYLAKYLNYGYGKLVGSEKRLIVKDNLRSIYRTKKTRLVVAEFDRLGLYFPVYYAAEKGYFSLHKLEVDFIATGGDDRTYASLVNNSAQIGLADPMFAMFENKEGVKGEIIGELVGRVPNLAVTIRPGVHIEEPKDFSRYRIGTFQEFSTTNSMAKYFLPKNTAIQPYDYRELIHRLVERAIDIAIVIPEQAIDLEALGGRVVFDFQKLAPRFLFSGLTIANTLESEYQPALKPFLSAVREASRDIRKNKEEAYGVFVRLFSNLNNPKRTFDGYMEMWSPTLKVSNQNYTAAHTMWKRNYPNLLKQYLPYFRTGSSADPILEKINARSFRRDFPFLEDVLQEKIQSALHNKQPLHFVGFWGASDKVRVDKTDEEVVEYFQSYLNQIKKVFQFNIKVTFILADEHAKSNQYASQKYKKYLSEINTLFKKRGFQTIWLSLLWQKWKLNQRVVKDKLRSKKKGWWSDVTIARNLETQANKRFQGNNKVFGAQKYFITRLLEKPHLEKSFRDAIFFTYSDSQIQQILPKLPTLYLYSRERGVSEVPWFRD